ncbi:hypothetical protein PENSPDRAFT_67733 [Peniophora sp. CONT]|nr:hypothetical protein PENSPDRAFT_67733 [Peniophora sp. CONT]
MRTLATSASVLIVRAPRLHLDIVHNGLWASCETNNCIRYAHTSTRSRRQQTPYGGFATNRASSVPLQFAARLQVPDTSNTPRNRRVVAIDHGGR